jgi:hypothetical protein
LQRSSLEYVNAMAALTRNAKVENELVVSLKEDFRKLLLEQAGVPLTWSWEEADTELTRRGVLSGGELIRASQEADFVAASRLLATIERKVRG